MPSQDGGWRSITPEDVLRNTTPTNGFLCPLSANIYGIEYLNFSIQDYATKRIIFEINRDNPPPIQFADLAEIDENEYRCINYEFSEDVLRLPTIQTSLVFSVGDETVPEFRMIERHYFRDQLVKSYDFNFGFCIPNSTNTWDTVYSVPPLDEELMNDMIDNPYETKSDRLDVDVLLYAPIESFYFVSNVLVMHNKASYRYIRENEAQAKTSCEESNRLSKISTLSGGSDDERKTNNYHDEVDFSPRSEEKKNDSFHDDSVWSKDHGYI